MIHSDPAATRVARFEIFLSQFLDAEGQVRAPLPDFARQPDTLRAFYRAMVEARSFDKKAVALQRAGLLHHYLSALGREAIGTAIGHALHPDDLLVPAQRECAALLVRGTAMPELLRRWAAPAETGEALPQALAAAHAGRDARSRRVVLLSCDESVVDAAFIAAATVATQANLPIVFVVASPQWPVPAARATLAHRALAAGVHAELVDGNDIVATHFTFVRAAERARRGGGPTLIEALSAPLRDGHGDDTARRRSADELRAAWERCPIRRLKRYIESQNLWSIEQEEALLIDAGEKVEAAARAFIAQAGVAHTG